MKTFCTLFLTDDPFHLTKDPGLLPKYMGRCGFQAHFISFIKPDEGRKVIPEGVAFDFLGERPLPENPVHMLFCKEVFRFLWKSRKEIDILNLYFLKYSIFYGIFFKLVNRKSKVYVKMDADVLHLEQQGSKPLAKVRDLVYRIYIRLAVDYISIESTKGYRYVSKSLKLSSDKLLCLPDGIDDDCVKNVRVLPFYEKKNTITCVGRLGTYQKNTEFLLEACKKVQWRDDWRLFLIGPCIPEFEELFDRFCIETGLENRIFKVGAVYDKALLMDYYNSSKIHCLSSRHESFGIVCAEAQYFGNYIVTTPVSSDEDFVPSSDKGMIVETPDEMAAAIQNVMDDSKMDRYRYDSIASYGNRLLWSRICRTLTEFITRE
ncbi:MAG: glycosyltransferase family 4 protein [Bacteroidales bacterium]|nr:glycosyltransferase family 4 protein [Candidatus Cacconaster merdequi]